jgi:Fic family protein
MRSGTYETQPNGHKAFIPAALPPNPPINLDPELWDLLSKADRALGRLDGATETLPNPNLFVAMYVRKEAVLSSQIEGTQASLDDLLEFEAEISRARDGHGDVVEVVNYVKAMNNGLARLESLPVSVRLLKEIHADLLDDVRGGNKAPGQLRTVQNWIGGSGSTIDKARFIPPPPHKVEDCLSDLERYIHAEEQIPILVKVGLIHAQFETIHPFLDGNGRMGRLLIAFLLCEKRVLRRPLLYLSHYLKANRSEYYDRLQATRDKGDWEGWLKFFLKGVATVADEATTTARKIAKMREEHRELVRLRTGKGAGRALELLEYLYWHPIVTVESAMEVSKTAYPNANRLVAQFVEMNLLRELTGQKRNRKFSYFPYLELFA